MNTDLILPFLRDLAVNNNRNWFHANRERYEAALEQVLALTQSLIDGIAAFDPEIKYLEPKECLFRIYRDTRFSLDKTPYKQHFGIYIAKNGGRRSPYSGYYLHIEPENCMVASGIWQTDKDRLKLMREAIDLEYEELQQIVSHPDHARHYGTEIDAWEKLKRIPQGYPADHPAAEWLKLKQMTVSSPFDESLITSPDLVNIIVAKAKAIKPFSDWCNRAIFG